MERSYAEYLLAKTKEDYNKIADTFSRARPILWEEMRFLVDDFAIPGEKILDLGCGNGRLYEILKDKKVDYFGVDSSEKLIEIAQKKFPEGNFQVAEALKLPFPSNYFDKIYSIAILHHIPSKEFRSQPLDEVKRILKPKGLLILTVWNLWPRSNPFGMLRGKQKSKIRSILKFTLLKLIGRSKLDFFDILIPWMGVEDCYFHCFRKRELENLIKKAKLEIKKSGIIIVSREKRPNSNFYVIAQK